MDYLSERIKDVDSVEEMRSEIFRQQMYDPLVRSVMRAADYSGVSSEDRYTMLAYHAIKAKREMQEQLSEFMKTSRAPLITLIKEGSK